jgi:hypothetical protein
VKAGMASPELIGRVLEIGMASPPGARETATGVARRRYLKAVGKPACSKWLSAESGWPVCFGVSLPE